MQNTINELEAHYITASRTYYLWELTLPGWPSKHLIEFNHDGQYFQIFDLTGEKLADFDSEEDSTNFLLNYQTKE